MKTTIYHIAFFALSMGFIGCSQAQIKKEENLDTAKVIQSPASKLAEKVEPNLTLESDYALFKVKATDKLNENEKKIGELKKKIKVEKKKFDWIWKSK